MKFARYTIYLSAFYAALRGKRQTEPNPEIIENKLEFYSRIMQDEEIKLFSVSGQKDINCVAV